MEGHGGVIRRVCHREKWRVSTCEERITLLMAVAQSLVYFGLNPLCSGIWEGVRVASPLWPINTLSFDINLCQVCVYKIQWLNLKQFYSEAPLAM